MIRRPPRSTLDRSSAASDVYKRQQLPVTARQPSREGGSGEEGQVAELAQGHRERGEAVSYTHLRAHETVLDIVCRLLLEKKT